MNSQENVRFFYACALATLGPPVGVTVMYYNRFRNRFREFRRENFPEIDPQEGGSMSSFIAWYLGGGKDAQ